MNELTGIERQLVLQYLMDANVPVTLTEEIENQKENVQDKNGNTVKRVSVGVFPVALPKDRLTVLKQNIILLKNPPESVKSFDGKSVRVQFYFNKLGLYFITEVKSVNSGLALEIPSVIRKIEEVPKKKSENLKAILYYSPNSMESATECAFFERFPLFVLPAWSDVEEQSQLSARNYLERFVMQCRSDGKSIGNGLFLISVCRYLAENNEEKSPIQERKNPPALIYIDEQRLVFAMSKDNLIIKEGFDYAIVLGFPIPTGPIKERTVYATFRAENIFCDDSSQKFCAICRYTSIKEEDARYLQDKKNIDR
ncbi:hypothetical protein [Treponema pectinovorum]|uniref:hypothetical protein n=1 Tax=Treponema pectinovorum TaxID=164 RepID=UPI0011F1FABD|nr:hypothetical protein [Treponema pectinovorum]